MIPAFRPASEEEQPWEEYIQAWRTPGQRACSRANSVPVLGSEEEHWLECSEQGRKLVQDEAQEISMEQIASEQHH